MARFAASTFPTDGENVFARGFGSIPYEFLRHVHQILTSKFPIDDGKIALSVFAT
jgi:hypothetical protein